ncbi:hypothetical protein [Microvirga mediterraneensis]|uniref:Uncharacterized protein n=1 Tax=Microvirga mediterraneensis TaxID=2754695 RepID=A0A838BN01_9HYPH|nr:hypothetical protein [Microvirga mediterraneensis]MBA1156897.1 hypothetical protein [Microvirga mediterraneensis]
MTILKAFGPRAREIKHSVDNFAHCADIAPASMSATANGPGEAEYDIEPAVEELRRAADTLEALDAKIKAARPMTQQAPRVPVLTYGQY